MILIHRALHLFGIAGRCLSARSLGGGVASIESFLLRVFNVCLQLEPDVPNLVTPSWREHIQLLGLSNWVKVLSCEEQWGSLSRLYHLG